MSDLTEVVNGETVTKFRRKGDQTAQERMDVQISYWHCLALAPFLLPVMMIQSYGKMPGYEAANA